MRNGGTLTVAQTSDAEPGSFLKTSVGNILSEYAVLETLTLIDAKTGQAQGRAGEVVEARPDGKSIDITLRDDVTFHSGRKLTARRRHLHPEKVQDPATGAANQTDRRADLSR